MKNKNNQITVITSLLCLLPLIMSAVVYNDLPEKVAIHWDSAGNPNHFAPKAVAAFGLPFFFLAINLFSKMRLLNDPKRAHTAQAMQIFILWMPPVLSLILVPVTLFIALGVNLPIALMVPVLVGVVFILCGNYLPKNRQNYTIGLKLPWTLHNADIWNKTHRLAGYLWIFGGIALIVRTFITAFTPVNHTVVSIIFFVCIILLLAVIPTVYAWLLYRKTTAAQD